MIWHESCFNLQQSGSYLTTQLYFSLVYTRIIAKLTITAEDSNKLKESKLLTIDREELANLIVQHASNQRVKSLLNNYAFVLASM